MVNALIVYAEVIVRLHVGVKVYVEIDHFHNDVKQSLKARRNIEYEKGDVPNSVCIGNCFEAEIRIQI